MAHDESAAEPILGPDQPRRVAGPFRLRREKITAEIERNRRGEYTVPTWVLALALLAFVAAWAALVVLS
jgi:hypothetical protein